MIDPVQENGGGGVGGAGLGVHGDHAGEGEPRHCQGLGGAGNKIKETILIEN